MLKILATKNATKKIFAASVALGFIASLLIPRLAHEARALTTQTPGFVDYSELEPGNLEHIIVAYHDGMNDFLNGKMDLLMDNDVTPETQKERAAVPDSKNFEECPVDYTSTWCVSMAMLNEYYRFRELLLQERDRGVFQLEAYREKAQQKLDERRKANPDLSEEELQKQIAPTYQDFITSAQENDSIVDHELGIAQQTLEMAVSAYDELRVSWSLHVKYLSLIDELEDYRNALANIRDEVELFPVTFFNVQTPQCT